MLPLILIPGSPNHNPSRFIGHSHNPCQIDTSSPRSQTICRKNDSSNLTTEKVKNPTAILTPGKIFTTFTRVEYKTILVKLAYCIGSMSTQTILQSINSSLSIQSIGTLDSKSTFRLVRYSWPNKRNMDLYMCDIDIPGTNNMYFSWHLTLTYI
jgi:hypothetical protein